MEPTLDSQVDSHRDNTPRTGRTLRELDALILNVNVRSITPRTVPYRTHMQEVRGSSPRATIPLRLEDTVTFRLPLHAGARPTGAFGSQTDSHRG